MKALATSLLSLAATVVFADGITLSTTESAGKLADDLAKQSGLRLSAAANVKDDIVILGCKNADVNDVMAQIAKVLHAEWSKSGEVLVLSRGSNLIHADERVEASDRVARFKAKIDEMAAAMKASGDFDAAAAHKYAEDNQALMDSMMNGGAKGNPRQSKSFEDMSMRSPASRAIIRLLASLPNSDLAMLGSGRRYVLSNRPTRMQSSLPGTTADIVRTFLKEQGYVTAATPPPANDGTRRIVINGFGDAQPGPGNPNDASIVMLVLNDRSPFAFSLTAQVRLVVGDSKGQTIFSSSLPIASKQDDFKAIKPAEGEKPIVLSDRAQEFDRAITESSGGTGMARKVFAVSASSGGNGPTAPMTLTMSSGKSKPIKVSPELRQMILHPETTDPLSFSAAEGLRAIAQSEAKSLCAYVPDNAVVNIARFFNNGSHMPTDFRNYVSRQFNLEVSDAGSWVTIEPHNQISARLQSVSRGGLGTVLRTMDSKKTLGLADVSAYAAVQTKAPGQNDFDLQYARIIDMPITDQILTPLDFTDQWLAARFFGLLSPTQRQTLLAGRDLGIGTLTPGQLETVNEMVFQGFMGPSAIGGPNPGGARFVFGGDGISSERTFVLPNGLPGNGVVRMKSSTQPVLQAAESDGTISQMTADQIAFQMYQSEHPEFNAGFGGDAVTMPSSFRPSSQNLYDMQFLVAPEYGIQRTLQDWAVGNGQFVGFDQLPSDVRSQVQQRLDQLRQGMKFANGNRPGAAPPPL